MAAHAASGAVGRGLGDRMILGATIVLAIVMVMPMLWAVGLSIKSNAELLVDTNSVLHAPWTLKNYADIIAGSSVFRGGNPRAYGENMRALRQAAAPAILA